MKSRITIEVDFNDNNLPVIQILSCNSDDVRDNLIKSFLQSLQHTSRWCSIHYIGNMGKWNAFKNNEQDDVHKWVIRPVTIKEIPHEIKLMEATINHVKGIPQTN